MGCFFIVRNLVTHVIEIIKKIVNIHFGSSTTLLSLNALSYMNSLIS